MMEKDANLTRVYRPTIEKQDGQNMQIWIAVDCRLMFNDKEIKQTIYSNHF